MRNQATFITPHISLRRAKVRPPMMPKHLATVLIWAVLVGVSLCDLPVIVTTPARPATLTPNLRCSQCGSADIDPLRSKYPDDCSMVLRCPVAAHTKRHTCGRQIAVDHCKCLECGDIFGDWEKCPRSHAPLERCPDDVTAAQNEHTPLE